MIEVQVRKQGGAAVVTIPSDLLKQLEVQVGATLEMDVLDGMLRARPTKGRRLRRYSLADLLEGMTPEHAAQLKEETAWAREGAPIGRELL